MEASSSVFSIADEKLRLEAELRATRVQIKQLEARYEALHEDYMHAITYEPPNLHGKVIAFVDADSENALLLQAISEHYNAKLIMPKNEDTVCYAIKVADHVLCLENCPNQNLCQTTYSTCAKYRKPVHVLPSEDIRHFSRQLASLAIEVKSPETSELAPEIVQQ